MIALIALAYVEPAHAECHLPIYVVESTIPSRYRDVFLIDLVQAMKVWNDIDVPITLTYMGATTSSWIYGAVTVNWTTDPGAVPTSIANTYNTAWPNGEIVKSKVDLLSNKQWCDLNSNYDCFNMKNVLIHELGHVLGLVHTEDTTSVMRVSEPKGWARSITPNESDIEHLKALYPPDGAGCSRRDDNLTWNASH